MSHLKPDCMWRLSKLHHRARCLSIFSSIAIDLNVPSYDFSSIAIEPIELTFVILGHGFKKAGSVNYDICALRTWTF